MREHTARTGRKPLIAYSVSWVLLTAALSGLTALYYHSLAQYHSSEAVLRTIEVWHPETSLGDLWARQDSEDHTCDEKTPCSNGACCGSYQADTGRGTCGFGPLYCGSDCTSNCNATSECGEYAAIPGTTCPLNVCCSQYGYCGYTDLFCDTKCQSNCDLDPAVPDGANGAGVLSKVIGYYESWSARRECYPFPPSALPLQGLTHVNFAFAYIDPDSFAVTTMDSLTPESLFTETTDVRSLKSGNSGLQVFVSIGGWTFSDNGTATQPTFGKIASSEANRQKFANNLVSFMREYGFDGVDLDWEYPGAPDRGGQDDDTANYVSLLRTLKQTFQASERGTYGLTFTIPSSYWYLRWFNVPAMLDYADWVNLMSYDIHGVWDSTNPIGSYVHAHTNLTEIQEAVKLLWRNDVPPGKVVLGMGFYGRSFQLSSSDCSEPGCSFAGAADPGVCTKNAGTLAYFEIADILDKQSPSVVWDKTAAIKYFQYGAQKDQWVSYDDSDTFKQKTDWANDVGLGGVMIWSVDQDNQDFDALSGLIGKELPTFADNQRAVVADAASWASDNGQKCVMTDCLKDSEVGNAASWPAGYAIAPNGDKFRDSCPKDKNKYILCPIDAMPSTCQWRGGETGCSCHGQCHTEEVTLFHTNHGSRSCCKPGMQAFCCQSNTWSKLVESCSFNTGNGHEDTVCPSNKQEVAWRYQSIEVLEHEEYLNQSYCCDTMFTGCHWIGKGTCDDNECADFEIEMATDPLGASQSLCAGGLNGRSKVLCCKPPANLNPFLPVPLENLFPTLPPVTDYPNFDLQPLQQTSSVSSGTSPDAFGFVVIDGPPDVVASLSKRDGSHIEFLDCESSSKQEEGVTYTARYICTNESEESNCDDIHLGGAAGTVVKLPEGCGYATYAVVHEIRTSTDTDVPAAFRRRTPPHMVVHEVDFSYDFSLVKRDSGDVYVRIDYGDTNDYWNKIVAGPASKKRGMRETIHPRFWSSSAETWNNLLEGIRHENIATASSLQFGMDDFNSLVYQQSSSLNTDACSNSGFLSINIKGSINSAIRWGFSLVGTISPTLSFEEAYGYYDSSLETSGTLYVNGKGHLSIPGGSLADMFSTDLSNFGFSHPGIVSFAPKSNIAVQLTGAGNLDADFQVAFDSKTDGKIQLNEPIKSLGELDGDVLDWAVDNAFNGSVSASPTTETGSDGTVFAITLTPRTWMEMSVFGLGTKVKQASAQFLGLLPHVIRVSSDGSTVKVTDANQQVYVEAFSESVSADWDSVSSQKAVGHRGSPYVIYSGAGDEPPDRNPPNWSGTPLLDGDWMLCSNATSTLVCLPMANMTDYDDTITIDPDTGEEYQRRALGLLDERGEGKGRPYKVTGPGGTSFTITSQPYPNGDNGDFLISINADAGYYILLDPSDCSAVDFNADGSPADGQYVTEHIVELNYISEMLTFMLNGYAKNNDGSLYQAYSGPPVDVQWLGPNSYFQTPYTQWDPQGSHANPDNAPVDDLYNAIGSTSQPNTLVNAEKVFNGFKSRVWRGINPIADGKWTSNKLDDTSEPGSKGRAEAAVSYLRDAISVFEYLNAQQINDNMAATYNGITAALEEFDQAVQRVAAHTIETSLLHREFFNAFLIPRIESVESWIMRHLSKLRQNWQAVLDQAQSQPTSTARLAEIQAVLDLLDTIEAEAEEKILLITTGFTEGLPSPPGSPKHKRAANVTMGSGVLRRLRDDRVNVIRRLCANLF